jgi:2,4-dienoyl-CoA reductase-like NADH-dependent reductase (Old Yellow Enzyme family)
MAAPVADNPLLQPYKLTENIALKHRIVYAPLTRCRAFGTIPQPLAAVSSPPDLSDLP